MDGYFRDEEASAAVLRDGCCTRVTRLVHDGKLFISGRAKELVVIPGATSIRRMSSSSRACASVQGTVAAFGRFDAQLGTEALVVAVESRAADDEGRARIATECGRAARRARLRRRGARRRRRYSAAHDERKVRRRECAAWLEARRSAT